MGESFQHSHFYNSKANMSYKTEVTRGVFDPRTYREDDPTNWARKRRSDWLAFLGKSTMSEREPWQARKGSSKKLENIKLGLSRKSSPLQLWRSHKMKSLLLQSHHHQRMTSFGQGKREATSQCPNIFEPIVNK